MCGCDEVRVRANPRRSVGAEHGWYCLRLADVPASDKRVCRHGRGLGVRIADIAEPRSDRNMCSSPGRELRQRSRDGGRGTADDGRRVLRSGGRGELYLQVSAGVRGGKLKIKAGTKTLSPVLSSMSLRGRF